MVLRITDSPEAFDISDYKITLNDFGNKTFHPMIAATNWECVYIDVNSNTPRGFIYQLVSRGTKIIPVLTEDEVSVKALAVLFEIFPDNVAELQEKFMQGIDTLKIYVAGLSEV